MPSEDGVTSSSVPSLEHGSYNLPTHQKEGDRLDYQHNLFRATFGGERYFSPLKSPRAILDLGCGTAIWSTEISDEFSQAKVVAMDLGQIQPPERQPLNHQYVVANFEEDWPFQEPFDYIHGRMIIVAMRNHPKVIQQAYQHLSPGGWFELQDLELGPDGVVENNPPSPAFRSLDGIMGWNKHMTEGSAKLGIDLAASRKLPAWLQETGFVNISHKMFKWPMGSWPQDEHLKSLGESALDNFLRGLEGFSTTVFTTGLGWSKEELQAFLEKTTKEMLGTDRHFYIKIHVFCAQKPGSD